MVNNLPEKGRDYAAWSPLGQNTQLPCTVTCGVAGDSIVQFTPISFYFCDVDEKARSRSAATEDSVSTVA